MDQVRKLNSLGGNVEMFITSRCVVKLFSGDLFQ